jgi:hypothetical protein
MFSEISLTTIAEDDSSPSDNLKVIYTADMTDGQHPRVFLTDNDDHLLGLFDEDVTVYAAQNGTRGSVNIC